MENSNQKILPTYQNNSADIKRTDIERVESIGLINSKIAENQQRNQKQSNATLHYQMLAEDITSFLLAKADALIGSVKGAFTEESTPFDSMLEDQPEMTDVTLVVHKDRLPYKITNDDFISVSEEMASYLISEYCQLPSFYTEPKKEMATYCKKDDSQKKESNFSLLNLIDAVVN